MKDGKQIRKNFKTEAEAVAEKQTLESQVHEIESSAKPRLTRLTDAQLEEAETSFKRLDGRSMTLAIDFFLKNYTEPVKPKLLSEAMAEFIAHKEAKNKRPDTIRNLKGRINLLVEECPGKHVHEVLKSDVETVVFGKGISARTQINNRLGLSVFFKWCVKQKYCTGTPVAEVERPEVDDTEPVALSLGEVRKLLWAAQSTKEGKLLPYFVLAIFAGIRPTELSRISWREIDLKNKIITLKGEHAKMRARRVVDLTDNVVEWLTPFIVSRPPIRPKNFRNIFDEVKELAGFGNPEVDKKLKPWVQDSPRHTAISHHYKHHGHEGKTASWAGNGPDTIHRYYKGLVTKEETQEFWSISPNDQEILNLGKAA
jgi:integrase